MISTYHNVYRKTAIFVFFLITLLLLPLPGPLYSDDLTRFFGDYQVEINGRVGANETAAESAMGGTVMPAKNYTVKGVITLAKSKPGIIAVQSGETEVVVASDNNLANAKVIQNPLHVYMGSEDIGKPGDFSVFSMLKVKVGDSQETVNLIYFIIETRLEGDQLFIKGVLKDRHKTERSAANMFSAKINSPIMGISNDFFIFDLESEFHITVTGHQIKGTFKGTGRSLMGATDDKAMLDIKFSGQKE